MKRIITYIFTILMMIPCLTACTAVGDKSAVISLVYGAAALLSLGLLAGCCRLAGKKEVWLLTLFVSVFVVNTGYFLLSVSTTLSAALWANRLSYLGSVFLPFSMMMIIVDAVKLKHSKRLPALLLLLGVMVFLIAASQGYSEIYYREVSLVEINGGMALEKVYGPLHVLYLIYLVGYFASMVAVILRSAAKKTVDSPVYSVIMAAAVFVNIGVWFIEQMTSINFEFLSLSYIISEVFLLGLYLTRTENEKLQIRLIENEEIRKTAAVNADRPTSAAPRAAGLPEASEESVEQFLSGLEELTQTEKIVYESYIARLTTKEVMASLNIKENTLKFHNKNLYRKLGVSSRRELLEVYKQIKAKEK